MERVQTNGQWSLFCPNEASGLADCWGAEFEKLYTHYEREVISVFPSWLYCIDCLDVNSFLFPSFFYKYLIVNFSIIMPSGQGKEGCPGSKSVV